MNSIANREISLAVYHRTPGNPARHPPRRGLVDLVRCRGVARSNCDCGRRFPVADSSDCNSGAAVCAESTQRREWEGTNQSVCEHSSDEALDVRLVVFSSSMRRCNSVFDTFKMSRIALVKRRNSGLSGGFFMPEVYPSNLIRKV